MSKLTEHQIVAMIQRVAGTVATKEAAGDLAGARRARKKLKAYRDELRERGKGPA